MADSRKPLDDSRSIHRMQPSRSRSAKRLVATSALDGSDSGMDTRIAFGIFVQFARRSIERIREADVHQSNAVRFGMTIAEPIRIAQLSCVGLLTVSYFAAGDDPSVLISAIIMSIVFLAKAAIRFHRSCYEHDELYRMLESTVDYAEEISQPEAQSSLKPPLSGSYMLALRDGFWQKIPVNVLVPGDIVQLLPGESAPCQLEEIRPSTAPMSSKPQVLRRTHAFLPVSGDNADGVRGVFRVLEFPLTYQLDEMFGVDSPDGGPSRRPKNAFTRMNEIVEKKINNFLIISVVCAAVALIASLLGLDERMGKAWPFRLLHQFAVLMMSALLSASEILRFLVDSICNGMLLVTDAHLRKIQHKAGHHVKISDIPILDALCLLRFSREWIPLALSIVRGNCSCATRQSNPFETLASVTAVCVLDKAGVLADTFASPEHMLVINQAPVTLDITADPTCDAGIALEADWQAQEAALKPLALSTALSPSCSVLGRQPFHRPKLSSKYPAPPILTFSNLVAEPSLLTEDRLRPSSCTCHIGKYLGFDPTSIGKDFNVVRVGYLVEQRDAFSAEKSGQDFSFLVSKLVQTPEGGLQLFSNGDPELVLAHAGFAWNGAEIVPLTQSVRNKTAEILRFWKHDDLDCVAYCYSPVPPNAGKILVKSQLESKGDENGVLPPVHMFELVENLRRRSKSRLPVSERGVIAPRDRSRMAEDIAACAEDIPVESTEAVPSSSSQLRSCWRSIMSGQILLGVVASRPQPKSGISECVYALNKIGVRFVFFSESSQRESLSFAERLGLDTDWNFFISLRDKRDDEKNNRSPGSANVSKLPEGISMIRDHLKHVDNVPLLVSLFTESSPSSECEMIRILQENGETVLCIGSSLNIWNSLTFMQADVPLAVQPMPYLDHVQAARERVFECADDPEDDAYANVYTGSSIYDVADHLNSLPCTFSLPCTTDMGPYVMGLLSQGRGLMSRAIQVLAFAAACNLTVFIVVLVTTCLGTAPILAPYQVLWIQCIIIPVLSFSLLFVAEDDTSCTLISEKNTEHLADDFGRFGLYYILRFFPSATLYVAIFVWMLEHKLQPVGIELTFLWNHEGSVLYEDAKVAAIVLLSQNIALCWFVYFLCWISLGFLYRNSKLQSFEFKRCISWIVGVVIVVLFQTGFCVTSLTLLPDESDIALPRWYIFMINLLSPIFIVTTNEFTKSHDRVRQRRHQQRLRIILDTKLGMHSPK